MFVGRNRELSIIKSELRSKNNSAIIIYGRRRIGKTSLILEALKDYDGIKIFFTAAPDEIKENIAALSRLTGEMLGEAWMNFQSPKDYFQYLGKREERIVLVIDEYQDFRGKNKSDALVLDAALRDFIDCKKSNIKLIISGSAIRVLENILEDNTNPLFMRFTKVVNLKELDYLEASCFYSEASIMEKIVERKTMTSVCHVACTTSVNIVDWKKDITASITQPPLQEHPFRQGASQPPRLFPDPARSVSAVSDTGFSTGSLPPSFRILSAHGSSAAAYRCDGQTGPEQKGF